MPVAYVGKSEYCYANSLGMVLAEHPVRGWVVPSPGRIECLTTMPFGNLFFRGPRGLEFFASPANTNPDLAIDLALDALGWTCESSVGTSRSTPAGALRRLRDALAVGPALVGPLDLGGLTHNPRAKYLRGGDHFVVAYAGDRKGISFQDPFGFPHAWLPAVEFLRAWNVGPRGYWRGPYTVRWNFRPRRPSTPAEAIARTLPRAQEALRADPGGPKFYGSLGALDQLEGQARKGLTRELRETLVYFSLPLGARRRSDAASFMEEAGRPKLARLFREQSKLWGRAQYPAVHKKDRELAGFVAEFKSLEAEAIAAFG